MEITAVEAIPVRVPLVPFDEGGIAPYVTNHGELDAVERVLVRLETDAGIEGWGEVRPFLSPAATVSVIEDGVGRHVLGQSPFEVEAFRRQVFVEYANIDAFFAPIETACWDIVGRTLDRPVYELLAGWTAPSTADRRHRDHQDEYGDGRAVETAYCLGILPPETAARRAEAVRDDGYRVLKTKAGRDWRADVDRIVAMDEATDGELAFRLDPNQGWRPDQAVRVAAALEDAGVYLQYLEQPVRVNDHGTLRALRERTCQPVAPNEDAYIAQNLRRMIEAGAMDAVVLDLTPAGGIAGLRQAVGIAADAGIPAAHHCAFDLGVRTAAILHAVHGLPGFDLPADSVYYGWESDVIDEPFAFDGPRLTVPDEPGLGVTVDRDAIDRFAIEG